MRLWHTLLVLWLNIVTLVVLVGGEVFAGYAEPSGLLISDGGNDGVLEIKEHDVHVTINNGIAITRVDLTCLNTENRGVKALHTFPVPKGASVSNSSMIINGKAMIGEVVETQRAGATYECCKALKRDPELLDQVDFKRFEMKIFSIAAGAEQKVSITYCQELDIDHNWSNYTYPLAATAVPGLDQNVHGRFSLTIDFKSVIPISKFKSSSHPGDIVFSQNSNEYVQAVMDVIFAKIDRDVVLAFQT